MLKNKIKLAVMLLMFCAAAAFAELTDILFQPVVMSIENMPMHEINLKVGFDFNGNCDLNETIGGVDGTALNSGNNASFAAEYYKYFNEYASAGVGVSAQMPRRLGDLSGNFGFAPVYIALKLRSWPQEPGMYGYAVGQLGYNFFYGDSSFNDNFKSKKDGFYYGIGFGIVYNAFLAEAIFSVNNGEVEDKFDNKTNIDYEKWTVSIGCKL